ncbi:hypothetical protein ACFSQ7_09345 [Paenibacillus rhizoplanae]
MDAESVYRAGIGLYADFTDLLESYAGLLLEQGQAWRAYPLLQQALDSGDTAHKYPSSSGSGTCRTRMFAGRVCERLFLYEEALEHYRQAIGYTPDDPAAWGAAGHAEPAGRPSGAADGIHPSAAPCPAPASAEQAGACRTQCPRRPVAGGASRSTAPAGGYPAGASGAARDAVPGPGTARGRIRRACADAGGYAG